jgi:hypothetical protein
VNDPILYEINTRCWLADLSEAAGRQLTLANVPDSEFVFWRQCGFTHIWLMGVWTLGERGRASSKRSFRGREIHFSCADIAGSPYAVRAYQVSRRLGGKAGLAQFRRKLNEHGMKLVLDFVPNHTALDHPWVRTHPEHYVTSSQRHEGMVKPFRGAAHWYANGACGYGPPWIDTLQLDYRSSELRAAMVNELLRVAAQCDGVRCDMAMLALNEVFARIWGSVGETGPNIQASSTESHVPTVEFWMSAITAVKRTYPGFLFLAEVYWNLEARLQELGFDYTYDKLLYDRIIARNARSIVEYLVSLPPQFVSRSAHFIENHDEPRIASLLLSEEHRAAATLMAGLPGMRFFHEGQFSGATVHANVHFARRRFEKRDDLMLEFYQRLFAALRISNIGSGKGCLLVAEPAWTDNPTHGNFALVQWSGEPRAFDLVAVNLAAHPSQCYAPLIVPNLTADHWHIRDLMGAEVHERSGANLREQGLYLDLPAHESRLFHFEVAR